MPYFENARVITASGSTFNYVGGNQFALRHTVATDQEQLDPDIELEHHDPSHIFQREELLGGIRQGDSMGFHGVDNLTDSVLTTNDVAVHDARLASHIRAEDEADKIPNIPSDVDDFPESPISVALEHARPASSGPGDVQIPAEHGVYPCEHVAIDFQYSTTGGTTDPRPTFGFGDNPRRPTLVNSQGQSEPMSPTPYLIAQRRTELLSAPEMSLLISSPALSDISTYTFFYTCLCIIHPKPMLSLQTLMLVAWPSATWSNLGQTI
jgi:hypothetical protein